MLNTTIENKITEWEARLKKEQSDTVFNEVPVSLDEFLYSRLFLNISKLSLTQYEFIKHGTQIYNKTEVEELKWEEVRRVGELVAFWGKSCFTGDTKVSLLDGTEKSFEELVKDYKDKTFWVYSYDKSKGVIPGLASNPRVTKSVSQLVEITLDNNEIIKCTPEHLFMLRDGAYKEAKDLDVGQSLMPLYGKFGGKANELVLHHKVASKRLIQSENPVFVYDLTVEEYNNFALSSGVFVHNSGKDMCSVVIQARIAYLLLCLNNPQKYFNLMQTSSIDMLNMAYNSEQAENVFFETFAETIRQCKWFEDKCNVGTRTIEFDKRIYAYSGHSFEEAFEGKNLIVAVLDEIAAFKTKTELEQMSMRRLRSPRYSAESVYDMAKSSVESRFPNGIGKVISLSFPRFKNDFIQQLYIRGLNEHTCYVSFGKTWDVNPYRKRSDFNDEFRKNPERAEARYACNPLGVEGGFFKNKEALNKAFPIILKERVPTTDDIFPILKPWFKCNHDFTCSIHVDLGLKHDKAGICMSHVSSVVEEEREKEDGSRTTIQLPVVTIDLLTSFISPYNGEIDISTIRQFIVDLVNRGFRIGKMTADQFNSASLLQDIAKVGIETDLRSVDRNTSAYDTLKELVYDNRLIGFSYIRDIITATGVLSTNEIIDELSNLIFSGRKVDHCQQSCFTGDTKVSLVDGRELSFLELLKMQEEGEEIWIYAVDLVNKRIVPCKAQNVRKTGKEVAKLLRITLDNNEIIECTPEHLFMLRDGAYKEAQELEIGQSLMPLYRKLGSKTGKSVKACRKRVNSPILLNHKIVNIQVIDGVFDVYDLEVPSYSNFALSAGVFVHNCKDLSDSCAGSVQGAIEIGLDSFSTSDVLEGDSRETVNDLSFSADREYLSSNSELTYFT